MVESDDNTRDLDDPVESDIGQFDEDNTSSNHAGTFTPSVISEILEPESYYPIVNGQRHVPLSGYESSTSNSRPLNPKAAVFESRE
ncbi:hypothetical protein V865_000083 [Kwoniella europaea PYCC6329]|uniref:Uncharacterized protein n=1 Tax=Kwoniella europaea PYCC6329 TaxID=1423913 RepID=A0AAX4K6R9_9TREE